MTEAKQAGGPVPFTVLTGFLGAGKTTTLNRLLARPGGRRIAVLVNELGKIPIDGRLIGERGGDLLELAGGCVCCKIDVKNDLWDGIADVVARSMPDQVVLETTGIAEPPALIEGLARLPDQLVGRITPAGVVCVVDAETAPAVLGRHEEARVQVESADRVILSKLDRAGPAQVGAAHRALDALGATADRASFPASEAGDRALAEFVLAVRAGGGAGGGGGAAGAAGAAHHAHKHGQLVAACFADPAPLLGDLVLGVMEELRSQLVRAKGFVHLAECDARGILELAGTALTLREGPAWAPGEARGTELVLIGADLDDAAIQRRLWACRAERALKTRG